MKSSMIKRYFSQTTLVNLNPVDWCEGQLGDNAAVKDGVEHGQERGEGKAW